MTEYLRNLTGNIVHSYNLIQIEAGMDDDFEFIKATYRIILDRMSPSGKTLGIIAEELTDQDIRVLNTDTGDKVAEFVIAEITGVQVPLEILRREIALFLAICILNNLYLWRK
jgi:acetyl-CoA carboxylase carboxyltransferase component